MLLIREPTSLSNFQTGIDVATDATLEAEQLISHIRTTVYFVSSLQGSVGEAISISEVYALRNKIHDILKKAFSKWVGNTALILVSHKFCC